MPRARAFISSTYYDLKFVRASLSGLLRQIGFDPILSEKGSIAYSPRDPLDESCYREVAASDLLILIVGSRYGSAATDQGANPPPNFFDRYDSVTRREFETAIEREIPVFILVDRAVFFEYHTYKRNVGRLVNYAHVDNPNVFALLDYILGLPHNNAVFAFSDFDDIEAWIREQWSGRVRELMQEARSRSDTNSLQAQVVELRQVTETLKVYLETLLKDSVQSSSGAVIEAEDQRLTDVRVENAVSSNSLMRWLVEHTDAAPDVVGGCVLTAESAEDLRNQLGLATTAEALRNALANDLDSLAGNRAFLMELNNLRVLLGGTKLAE